MEILDGRYVGNGEKNLYFKELGEGSPTIIIEPAWGGLSAEWQPLQIELAKIAKTVSYDRAGYGESPRSENPRTSFQIANELKTALVNAGIEPPYVFVGHEAGGFYSMQYFKLFPDDVAGLVLVDSRTSKDARLEELDVPKYRELLSLDALEKNLKAYLEYGEEELAKTITPHLAKLYQNYPDYLKEALIAYQSERSFYQTVLDEMAPRRESEKTLEQTAIFSNIPVAILARDFRVMIPLAERIGVPKEEARAVEEIWLENQKYLLELSTDAEFAIVTGAGRNIHYENPNAILRAVQKVWEKSKEI